MDWEVAERVVDCELIVEADCGMVDVLGGESIPNLLLCGESVDVLLLRDESILNLLGLLG